MNEEILNMSLRKYLKKVGVTSQREIEAAVREAVEAGRVDPSVPLKAKVRLTLPEVGLDTEIDGAIELE